MNIINCFKCGNRTFAKNRKVLANRLILCNNCFVKNNGFVCRYCNFYYLQQSYNKKENCCFYCINKEHRNNQLRIHNYFFKPYPIFYQLKNEDKLYLGVQLQIGGVDKAKIVNEFAINNENKFIYIKSDSTIPQFGCQLVSYPATLEYHLSKLSKWKTILRNAKNNNFKSYSIQDCGLHIHVNKDFFTQESIKLLDYFVNENEQFFVKIARRYSKYSKYLLKPYDMYGTPININRHCALNLCNDRTIQFRIFKGTLNYNSLMAYFELVYNLCYYIKQCKKPTKNDFIQFVSNNNTQFLKKFLIEKIYKDDIKWKELVKKLRRKR